MIRQKENRESQPTPFVSLAKVTRTTQLAETLGNDLKEHVKSTTRHFTPRT